MIIFVTGIDAYVAAFFGDTWRNSSGNGTRSTGGNGKGVKAIDSDKCINGFRVDNVIGRVAYEDSDSRIIYSDSVPPATLGISMRSECHSSHIVL